MFYIIDDRFTIKPGFAQAFERYPIILHPPLDHRMRSRGVACAHLVHVVAVKNGKGFSTYTVISLENGRAYAALHQKMRCAEPGRASSNYCNSEWLRRAHNTSHELYLLTKSHSLS